MIIITYLCVFLRDLKRVYELGQLFFTFPTSQNQFDSRNGRVRTKNNITCDQYNKYESTDSAKSAHF